MTNNNEDRLKKYVKEHFEMEILADHKKQEKVRFSITLDLFDHIRLEALLKKLGMKKNDFINDATKLLMKEFESQLELDTKNNKKHWDDILELYSKKINLK